MEITITIKVDNQEVLNQTIETDESKKVDENRISVSQYARFFDESCTGWDKDPECNLLFLRQQQVYANELLRKCGYLFLNDVYDILGIPRSKEGQIVGWIYDDKNPIGDNFVNFGIYNPLTGNRNFVNGYEKSILLDFNVDGNILDKI